MLTCFHDIPADTFSEAPAVPALYYLARKHGKNDLPLSGEALLSPAIRQIPAALSDYQAMTRGSLAFLVMASPASSLDKPGDLDHLLFSQIAKPFKSKTM